MLRQLLDISCPSGCQGIGSWRRASALACPQHHALALQLGRPCCEGGSHRGALGIAQCGAGRACLAPGGLQLELQVLSLQALFLLLCPNLAQLPLSSLQSC